MNPNNPARVPINMLKKAPTKIIIGIINFLYFLSFTYGKYINIVSNNIELMLFPDSNQPLYPIPSIYVCDDVFVSIAI